MPEKGGKKFTDPSQYSADPNKRKIPGSGTSNDRKQSSSSSSEGQQRDASNSTQSLSDKSVTKNRKA